MESHNDSVYIEKKSIPKSAVAKLLVSVWHQIRCEFYICNGDPIETSIQGITAL